MIKRSLKSGERGATLIEAMVTVLILSIGLIPSLAIIVLASSFSSSIKNNLIAANLAQEGIEVVRAMRDDNWFNVRVFDNGLAAGTYRVDWSSNSLLSENGNPVLKLNSVGLYNYSSGTDTNFHRRIIITKISSNELKILAEVSWAERGRVQTINTEAHLYDWK